MKSKSQIRGFPPSLVAASLFALKHPTHPWNAHIKSATTPQIDDLLHFGVHLLIPLEAASPGDWCLDLQG
jgi:hypothetical protein